KQILVLLDATFSCRSHSYGWIKSGRLGSKDAKDAPKDNFQTHPIPNRNWLKMCAPIDPRSVGVSFCNLYYTFG
ncbi:MAG: hypothetical protein AAFW73_12475, partial [Bacteroidota bacterium]